MTASSTDEHATDRASDANHDGGRVGGCVLNALCAGAAARAMIAALARVMYDDWGDKVAAEALHFGI
jgi:hypothetical protein